MKKLLFPIALAICCLILASCTSEQTQYEANQLLPVPSQTSNVLEKASELSPDSIVATLMAISTSRYDGSSASVAYVLLSNGDVLVFKREDIRTPFTKEQAKILMLAKMKGKMLSAED